jgi:hypothetical protein
MSVDGMAGARHTVEAPEGVSSACRTDLREYARTPHPLHASTGVDFPVRRQSHQQFRNVPPTPHSAGGGPTATFSGLFPVPPTI